MNKKIILLFSFLVVSCTIVWADDVPTPTALPEEMMALDALPLTQPQEEPTETPIPAEQERKQNSFFGHLPQETVSQPAQVPVETPTAPTPAATPQNSILIPEQKLKSIPALKLPKQKNLSKKLIDFDFDNEDLTKIINKFAELQHINIIFPSGAHAITQKVTFKLKKRIPFEQAERYLYTLLDIAGYSIVPHGDFYLVVKNDNNIVREPLPLFVDVPPQELPADGRIQVIYYLQNIKVPDSVQGGPNDQLKVILDDMLTPQRAYLFDTKANALIISDKASNIKATMAMLLELDAMGVQDVVRQIQLFHASAANVAQIMNSQILAVSGTAQGRIRAEVKSEAGLYFAPGTKIVGDVRTNSLIVMGKEPAVERITNFVRDYVDIPVDSGNSILHYYELQYLDAEKFADVLKKIVTTQGPSGQATTEQGGTNRAFDGVIIVPEKPVEEIIEKLKLVEEIQSAAPGSQSVLKGTVYRGGNRLIVAARERDWQRIKKLIHDLDKPQYQVIIQVMIIDFDVNTNKIFGTQTRNPSFFQLPEGFNFQTTNLIAPPISFQNTTPPKTLATDLLALISGYTPLQSEAALLTNATQTQGSVPPTTGQPGSLILSVNDTDGSGIWTFLQWLESFGETRILSHPYLIARNNTKADEIISTIKRVAGDASTGEGGLLAQKIQEIEAALKVSVVPRVSSQNRVNLQISVTINNFVGGSTTNSSTGNSVNTRELHTDVNMSSGQMLVLGGLTRTDVSEADNETPLLGRIPVIRWLFSSNKKSIERTNVTVFLIPTIVEPKIRAGLNKYTKDKIDFCYKDVEEGDLFDQMRDPVTYLFFKGENVSADSLDEYLADTQGDFVRRNRTEKHRGPIKKTVTEEKIEERPENQRLENEQFEAELLEKNIITKESQSLKRQIATEKNPLLTPRK